jgi:hypothetical protein
MTKKDPEMNPTSELELADQVQIWEEGLARGAKTGEKTESDGPPRLSSPSFI